MDWTGAPAPPSRRRLRFLGIPYNLPSHFFAMFFTVSFVLGGLMAYVHRDVVDHFVRNYIRGLKTQAEMSVIGRALAQHKAAYGKLPGDIRAFVAGSLKKNKPYPSHCDHWGHPYRFEFFYEECCLIRSAGTDGKYQTRDDLTFKVVFPER